MNCCKCCNKRLLDVEMDGFCFDHNPLHQIDLLKLRIDVPRHLHAYADGIRDNTLSIEDLRKAFDLLSVMTNTLIYLEENCASCIVQRMGD